jgi:excisionase family DNA binding protein
MSVSDAALALGVSRQRVMQLVRDGLLTTVLVGRRVWIACSSLDAELARRGGAR